MNGPLWRRWLLAALAFALIAALLTWLMPGDRSRLQLADGRMVSVIETTFGTTHIHEEGSALARWVARVGGPARGSQFGLRSYRTTTPTHAMVVWTEWFTTGSNRPPRYASIRLRSGFETEPVSIAVEGVSTSNKSRTLVAWRFENYPRRAETFEVRFHERPPPYRPAPLGAVTVRNVERSSAPALGGKEPPISVVQDGITFKLVRLTTGEDLPLWRRGTETGLAPWTTATFEVREGGSISTNWTIRRIIGDGATSNRFSISYSKVAARDGLLTVGFANVLWPDEPDWNLAVEFVGIRNFDPEDLWTLRGVPANHTNGAFTTNVAADVHRPLSTGVSLQPARIQTASDGRTHRTADLWLSYTSSLPELRAELVRAVDNHGRELKRGDGVYLWPFSGPSGRYAAEVELAADSESVDLTFAFQRPHRIEFKVKPSFIRTNLPSPFPAPGK